MLVSKALKNISFYVLTLPILGFSLGCSIPSPERQDSIKLENESANFTIKSYKADLIPDTTQRTFSISNSRNISFEICLKELSKGKNLQNLKFNILESNEILTTDLEGCINWQEEIKYNAADDAKYLLIERTVSANGLYRGTRKVSFAFNPWSVDERAVILDGKKAPAQTITDKLEVAAILNSTQKNSFKMWIEDARLITSEKSISNDNVTLNYELRFTPRIQITTANGEITSKPINTGKFKASIHLLHRITTNSKDTWYQLAKTDVKLVEMSNGSLSVSSDLKLAAIPTRGQIFIGLSLDADNSEVNFQRFDGIYQVGEYDTLKAGAFLKLSSIATQEKNFSISSLNIIEASVNDDSFQKAQIEISPLEFKFLRVSNETTTTRDVTYQIRACFKNGLDQKNVRAQTFEITKFKSDDRSKSIAETVRTDNSACIQWAETMTTKVYECQRYVQGRITIKNSDIGLNQTIGVMINPWEQWSAAGRDMRYINPSEKMQTSCASKAMLSSQIQIDNYSFTTLSYNYEVDKTLSLKVKKKVLFKIEPKVLTYSDMNKGRESIDRLRDGTYILKVAVIKNRDYDNANTLVLNQQKLVTALSGQITTELELETSDFKSLGNRNNILIELSPADESKAVLNQKTQNLAELNSMIDRTSGLTSPSFLGPIVLNLDENSRILRRTDIDNMTEYFLNKDGVNKTIGLIDNIVTQGQQKLQEQLLKVQNKSGKNQFAAKENLSIFNLNEKRSADYLAKIAGLSLRHIPRDAGYSLDFANLVTARANGQLDTAGFSNLLNTGVIGPKLGEALCAWWFFEHLPSINKSKGGSINPKAKMHMFLSCAAGIKKDTRNFFIAEKELMVLETQPEAKILKGTNHGVSVGTGFTLSNAHSNSVTRTSSISVKAGLSFKFFDALGIGLDSSYSISNATSDSLSNTNSVAVGATTSMNVQKNTMEITIKKHESCVTIRMNPRLFIKDPSEAWYNKRRDFINVLNHDLAEAELTDAVTRGILVCSGAISNTPVKKMENYYLVVQETSSNSIQDAGNELNRALFIGLRGDADYEKLMFAMKASNSIPDSAQNNNDLHSIQIADIFSVFAKGSGAHPGVLKVP